MTEIIRHYVPPVLSRKKVDVSCEICGEITHTYPNAVFCSNKCRQVAKRLRNKGKTRQCATPGCDGHIYTDDERRKYCRACR